MKFGYVVFCETAVVARLLEEGMVMVRGPGREVIVRVKRMDGMPATFDRN